MDGKQADEVAEALLAPTRETQADARDKQARRDAKRARQQWIAGFGLAGFCIGAAIGAALGDGPFPAGLAGIALGMAIAYAIRRRVP